MTRGHNPLPHPRDEHCTNLEVALGSYQDSHVLKPPVTMLKAAPSQEEFSWAVLLVHFIYFYRE